MEKQKTLHDGHRERLREKYERFGLDVLAPHEVLELVLFYAVPRRDTNPLAHRILEHFDGSLHRVFSATAEELQQVEGVGKNTALLIQLFADTNRRVRKECSENIRFLNNFSEIGEYLQPYFEGRRKEVVMFLALDGKKKVICCKQLFEGSFDAACIGIRDLLSHAMMPGTVFVTVAHNHPSGNAVPSEQDIASTTKMVEILSRFGALLIDHLIFSDNDYVSFAQSGLLNKRSTAGLLFRDDGAALLEDVCPPEEEN